MKVDFLIFSYIQTEKIKITKTLHSLCKCAILNELYLGSLCSRRSIFAIVGNSATRLKQTQALRIPELELTLKVFL